MKRSEYLKAYMIHWRREHPDYPRKYRKKHPEIFAKSAREWRENNPEKKSAHNLIYRHQERYPLDSKCAFCEATERLEHGHIDYGLPEIYLTVCHQCNWWMDKPIMEGKKT